MAFNICRNLSRMVIVLPVIAFGRRCFASARRNWPKIKMNNESLPPHRADPVILKLDTPAFRSIITPEVSNLAELFKKRNYELRIAGGAVRDILMGLHPKDLDFATDATPDQMKEMFTEENVRMINAKGEKHGTITARINDKENFEVTTLRIDVATDGRHADVKFTNDWKLDAHRRDLTINSMFLDLEGRVYDYFFGYEDLQSRRVAFVGSPEMRIKEDYLRIFRYFRFYGRIAVEPDVHEEATLKAIKDNVSGLERISGERIWREWSKILSGNYAFPLTLKMMECGIFRYAGLPENPDIENFKHMEKLSEETDVPLTPITLLTSMLKDEEEVMNLHARLKLSIYDRDLALFLIKHREEKPSPNIFKTYLKILIYWNGKVSVGRKFLVELLRVKGHFKLANELNEMVIPRFPVNGYMVKDQVSDKLKVGLVLRAMKDIWVDRNFEATGEELLKEVPRILDDIESRRERI